MFGSIYMCDGLPPLSIVPCFRRSESYGDIYQLLPERLGYRVRLHRIQVEATNLISGSCDVHGKDNDSTLSSMIISYDEIARSLPMPQDNNTCGSYRDCPMWIWKQLTPDQTVSFEAVLVCQLWACFMWLNKNQITFTVCSCIESVGRPLV